MALVKIVDKLILGQIMSQLLNGYSKHILNTCFC